MSSWFDRTLNWTSTKLAGAVAGTLIGGVGQVVSWLIYGASVLATFFISILIYLIGVILQLSNNVVNTLAVTSGYSITLSITNLGFVLAIIVIALATILHRESYGIKKTLWKLVVAAILVNFSLVIGGAIIGFANTLTLSFLAPLGGSPWSFANALSTAFAPQRALLDPNLINQVGQQAGGAGNILASIIAPIIGFAAALGFLIVILITLAVLCIMLLVRYIAIAFLLILMPFAWLLWLFPQTAKHWSRWWSEFIRWTFFAPIVVFFLYLAIKTAEAMANNNGGPLAYLNGTVYMPNSTTNPIIANISQNFGTFAGNLLTTFLQGAITIGLAVGGMYVANKLSITGASAGMGAMRSVGNVGKRFATQRGKQAITTPLRLQSTKNLASRMQQRSPNKLMKFTGMDYLKRQAGSAIQAGGVASGEKMVTESGNEFKGLTPEQRLNRLSTARGPYGRIALLKQIADDKNLNKLSREELENYLGKGKEGEFKRYGQEKAYKELREKSGLAFQDANDEIDKMREEGKDPKEIADKEKDRSKMLASYIEDNADAAAEVFTDPEKLQKKRDEARSKTGRIPASLDPVSLNLMQESIVRGVTQGLSPHNVSSLVNALSKKNNLDGFSEAVKRIQGSSPDAFQILQKNLRENSAVLNWNNKNLGRGTLDVDLRQVYGIGDAAGEPSRIITAEEGPRNVRERVRFDEGGNIIK